MPTFPILIHTALDTTDCRGLAEFYRQFLGLHYRPGDEPSTADGDGDGDGGDWLVLLDSEGNRVHAFNEVPTLAQPDWPAHNVPKQMHHDYRVPSMEELQRQRRRAEDLGATVLYDRTDDAQEPLYVLADPAGHPFCLLVVAE